MKISVAMCTYNGARFVREQLESIAAQTRPPDELVVCDDCSEDATSQIVRDFATATQFPLQLVVNETIHGSTKNFERAISLCSGDVIALSDQDDVWRNHKLASIERCFSEDARIGLVFSDAEVVDERLNTLAPSLWSESGFDKSKQKLIHEGKAFEVLLPAWWVTGATMAFRSEYKPLILPIPMDLSMIHDGWISLMIAAVATVKAIPEPLVSYRQHQQQQLGAPTKRRGNSPGTVTKLSARLKSTHYSYADQLKSLERIHQRLVESGMRVDRISLIEDQVKHLKARSNLPVQVSGRISLVLRELLAMRYHKYSNGVLSAARDLLYEPSAPDPSRGAG